MSIQPYLKQRNASIIAFSPSFKEAVKVVRSVLRIPIEGFGREEANEWYKKHHTANTRERRRPLPRYYWHFPREFVEMLHSFRYSTEPSRVNFYGDVPLDRYAMELMHRFDLPEDLVDEVKAYILLAKYHSLSTGPALQLILVPVNEGQEGTKYIALIAGIDAATTQKDWLEVWENVKAILRLSGISDLPHKRPIDNLLLRDLTFWKEIRKAEQLGKLLRSGSKSIVKMRISVKIPYERRLKGLIRLCAHEGKRGYEKVNSKPITSQYFSLICPLYEVSK